MRPDLMRRRQRRQSAFVCSSRAAVATAGAIFICTSASWANTELGKAIFGQKCALCHSAGSADEGGAQGPSLTGIFGRRSAADPSFAYTPALTRANLIW